MLARLDGLKIKYEEIGQQMTDPEVIADMKKFVALNKEYKELQPVVEASEKYRTALNPVSYTHLSGPDLECAVDRTGAVAAGHFGQLAAYGVLHDGQRVVVAQSGRKTAFEQLFVGCHGSLLFNSFSIAVRSPKG